MEADRWSRNIQGGSLPAGLWSEKTRPAASMRGRATCDTQSVVPSLLIVGSGRPRGLTMVLPYGAKTLLRIVAYQVMSNHFHLVLQAPEEPSSAEETARRFAAFHGGRRRLAPDSPLCEQWRARLRDVSWCRGDTHSLSLEGDSLLACSRRRQPRRFLRGDPRPFTLIHCPLKDLEGATLIHCPLKIPNRN